MTPFEKVYAVVSSIPGGKVLTYKKVAQITGIKNPRFVGFALHRNSDPQHIPCHRVVKSDGTITSGYAFGGPAKQKEKLLNEGVQFSPNGHINLQKSLYKIN